ncbi:MAG TPA: OmpA family protein [Permianibacter sp.]|nr:OmpA family protein [Permianibacter sp.]
MRIKWGVLAGAVALALTGTAGANDGGWEPTFGYGWQMPDEDRGLENDSELKYFGLGYYLTEEVMLELYGAEHDTEIDGGGLSVDSSQLGMKALYHFETTRPGIIPYVALGLNEIKFEADGAAEEESETGIMFGLGLKTYFTERLSLRLEVNNTRYEETHEHDSQFWVGLSYLFGGGSAAPAMEDEEPAPVAEPTPAPQPAPAPAAPKDSDGDGVLDTADQCPNTAAGRKVDEKGCEKVLREKVSIKLNVLFETARTDIKPESATEIKRVADFMTDYPTTKVVIEGHTDSIGSNELNKSLSERRAKAVADALVRDYGIDASRVSSVGYGEERPLADNNTAEGRAQNRRVTAEIEETVVVSQ